MGSHSALETRRRLDVVSSNTSTQESRGGAGEQKPEGHSRWAGPCLVPQCASCSPGPEPRGEPSLVQCTRSHTAHPCPHRDRHTWTHMCTHTLHRHMYTRMFTHIDTHRDMHTHADTHTQTHSHRRTDTSKYTLPLAPLEPCNPWQGALMGSGELGSARASCPNPSLCSSFRSGSCSPALQYISCLALGCPARHLSVRPVTSLGRGCFISSLYGWRMTAKGSCVTRLAWSRAQAGFCSL